MSVLLIHFGIAASIESVRSRISLLPSLSQPNKTA